jgi:hypothetical protein
MLRSIVFSLLLIPALASAKGLDWKDSAWAKSLKESQVKSFHVCGDADIQPTKKSLMKDFFLSEEKSGLLFTGMVPSKEYWLILSEENLEGAKSRLKARFGEARLWKVTESGQAKDIGSPTEIDLPFTATVKDCMEGAKTSLGSDCSLRSVEARTACCREKFSGPRLKWAVDGKEYHLRYSPDPSVQLRVGGEKRNRFCDVQRALIL